MKVDDGCNISKSILCKNVHIKRYTIAEQFDIDEIYSFLFKKKRVMKHVNVIFVSHMNLIAFVPCTQTILQSAVILIFVHFLSALCIGM